MAQLWERQTWDTNVSYVRFVDYYLAQDLPRSLDKAWREFQAQKRHIPAAQVRSRAGRSWRNWFEAKTVYSKPIPGAVGWSTRAAAYDDYLLARRLAQYEAERDERRLELRIVAAGAFQKLIKYWNEYNPDVEEFKLSELVSATKVIAHEVRTAYDLLEPQRFEHRVFDWRNEVLQLVERGIITMEDVRTELGDELAQQLFERPGSMANHD